MPPISGCCGTRQGTHCTDSSTGNKMIEHETSSWVQCFRARFCTFHAHLLYVCCGKIDGECSSVGVGMLPQPFSLAVSVYNLSVSGSIYVRSYVIVLKYPQIQHRPGKMIPSTEEAPWEHHNFGFRRDSSCSTRFRHWWSSFGPQGGMRRIPRTSVTNIGILIFATLKSSIKKSYSGGLVWRREHGLPPH